MSLKPDAPIEITAFRWVPEFAQGLVIGRHIAIVGSRGSGYNISSVSC